MCKCGVELRFSLSIYQLKSAVFIFLPLVIILIGIMARRAKKLSCKHNAIIYIPSRGNPLSHMPDGHYLLAPLLLVMPMRDKSRLNLIKTR